MANVHDSRSSPRILGTIPGTTLEARRIHATSAVLRSSGAVHSAATLSFASARFRHRVAPCVSTRTMREDTPPASGV